MRRLLRGHGDRQGLWIGQPDVFAGQDHQPACDEHQVLARLEHARQPVDSRVRVRATHGFNEGRDRVVVRVAGFVVEQSSLLHRVFDQRQVQDPGARRLGSVG